jgi:hypothetical protein
MPLTLRPTRLSRDPGRPGLDGQCRLYLSLMRNDYFAPRILNEQPMTEEYKSMHRDFAAWFDRQETAGWSSPEERRAADHLRGWLRSLAQLRNEPPPALLQILSENIDALKKARDSAVSHRD